MPGYELTFVMAPRSMQGTAMGIFYFLEGSGNLIYLLPVYLLPPLSKAPGTAKTLFWTTGVAGNTIGLLLLIFVHRKFNLGLSVP